MTELSVCEIITLQLDVSLQRHKHVKEESKQTTVHSKLTDVLTRFSFSLDSFWKESSFRAALLFKCIPKPSSVCHKRTILPTSARLSHGEKHWSVRRDRAERRFTFEPNNEMLIWLGFGCVQLIRGALLNAVSLNVVHQQSLFTFIHIKKRHSRVSRPDSWHWFMSNFVFWFFFSNVKSWIENTCNAWNKWQKQQCGGMHSAREEKRKYNPFVNNISKDVWLTSVIKHLHYLSPLQISSSQNQTILWQRVKSYHVIRFFCP